MPASVRVRTEPVDDTSADVIPLVIVRYPEVVSRAGKVPFVDYEGYTISHTSISRLSEGSTVMNKDSVNFLPFGPLVQTLTMSCSRQ